MKLYDAINHVKDDQSFRNSKSLMLGLAHEDNGTFITIRLNYDCDDESFVAGLEGGRVLSSEGVCDDYFGETVEELMADIPDEYQDLNYKVYSIDEDLLDLSSEFFLEAIFPDLPKIAEGEIPSKMEIAKFVKEAEKAIDQLNKESDS